MSSIDFLPPIQISFADFDWKVAVFIFAAYFIIDFLYAKYTLGVMKYEAHRAARYAVMIYVLISVGVLSLFANFLYVIPLALGSYLGTYLTVRREANKLKKV